MKTVLTDPSRLFEIGRTMQHAGRLVDAIDVLSEASRLDPGRPDIRFQRALCFLQCGWWGQGWPDYELRLHDHPLAKWLGRETAGRRLIVCGEQGIGDEIMFASCIPDLLIEHGPLTLIADTRLHSLFAHSFPGVEVPMTDSRQIKSISAVDNDDALIMLGSLGKRYRYDAARFTGAPYLLPDPDRREFFKSVTHNRKGLSVGLAWRGGIAETRRHLRSLCFNELRPILSVSGADFYTLQHDEFDGEIYIPQAVGKVFAVTKSFFDDWLELASFVSSLDLVITVQSSIVHLCGALGVPCWALVPAAPEWRYGITGDSMPWYRSVKLYRQSRLGDWSPVLERVRRDLQARIEERK